MLGRHPAINGQIRFIHPRVDLANGRAVFGVERGAGVRGRLRGRGRVGFRGGRCGGSREQRDHRWREWEPCGRSRACGLRFFDAKPELWVVLAARDLHHELINPGSELDRDATLTRERLPEGGFAVDPNRGRSACRHLNRARFARVNLTGEVNGGIFRAIDRVDGLRIVPFRARAPTPSALVEGRGKIDGECLRSEGLLAVRRGKRTDRIPTSSPKITCRHVGGRLLKPSREIRFQFRPTLVERGAARRDLRGHRLHGCERAGSRPDGVLELLGREEPRAGVRKKNFVRGVECVRGH